MIGARGLVWFWYRSSNGTALSASGWEGLAVCGSAVSGVLWGSAGFSFYPAGDEVHRIALTFLIGGMGAGAAAALSSNLLAFYAYLTASILPFAFRLAISHGQHHLLMAVACLTYFAALIVLTRRTHRWLGDALALRYENTDLVHSLEYRVFERTTQLEEINAQLFRDIAERRRAEAALADYADRQHAVAVFGERALSGADLQVLFDDAARIVGDRLRTVDVAVLEHVPERRLLIPAENLWLPAGSSR